MTRKNLRRLFAALCLMTSAAFSGCRPRTGPDPLITQIAAQVYATMTASLNMATPPPPATPTASKTPTPCCFQTPTPQARARVHSNGLNLREGPGREHPTLETLERNEILLVIGKKGDCDWLKVFSPNGAKGWVSGDPIYVVLDAPCYEIPFGSYRPLNGELLYRDPAASGLGELQVSNLGEKDLALTVTNYAGGLLYALYIRSRQSAAITLVPDGSYTLTFVTGREWLGDLGTFAYPEKTARLRDPLIFRTTQLGTSRLTLALGDDSRAELLTEIPFDEFPFVLNRASPQ